MTTRAWVIVVVALAGAGCKKKPAASTDPGSGSGSDVMASGSAPAPAAVPDAVPAVITPTPTPTPTPATVDAAAATTPTPAGSALDRIPAPATDCDGPKCTELAGSEDKGSPERAALFKHGCDTGDAAACALLAVTFEQGIGLAKDVQVAATLYDKACTMGDVRSCETFGMLMLYGAGSRPTGIEPQPDRGIEVLDKACKAEAWSACTKLGDYLISNGQRDRALQTYRVACDHQDKPACTALAKVQ